MARTMCATLLGRGSRRAAVLAAALLGSWLLFAPATADEGKQPAAPAKSVSDEDFVRRIHLDLTGALPTPAEVARFLADKDLRKREKLIDQLLLKRWDSLEDLLGQAMKNNPDIRVAESKLREAEAELNRTRLQVMQKVVTLRQNLEAQKNAVQAAEARFKRIGQLHNTKVIPAEMVEETQRTLLLEKAKLTALEAELPYLLGQSAVQSSVRTGSGTNFSTVNLTRIMENHGGHYLVPFTSDHAAPPYKLKGTIFDKIRKARDQQVTLNYKDKPAKEVLEDLLGKIEGVPYRYLGKGNITNFKVDLEFKESLSLGAALQAWQDLSGGNRDIRFVVRDYGILVTDQSMLPEGAILLHDFWKAAGDPNSASPGSGTQPAPKK